MGKHTLYYELQEALQVPGCALCRLAGRSVQRFMESLVYEYANDPHVQQEVQQARGFCNLHAWQLSEQTGAVLDLAILNSAALRALLEPLRAFEAASLPDNTAGALTWLRARLSGEAADSAALAAELAPQATCPACRIREQTEVAYSHVLLEHSQEPEIAPWLEQSGGLCWPHLRLLLRQPASMAQLHPLLQAQRAATERLLAELQELIRKQDYRFQDEPPGTERDAWLRAVGLVSGARGIW